ncbi:antitoxin [Streptomyces sp. NPDC093109]|uniref:antitoxin n=1 Tax=Streptomyces sp. NPDC093109 TaxID=3154977 RepID=UPI00344E7C45
MSMLDKLKGLIKGHENTARKGVEKAGDMLDRKTGNKYKGQVDAAQKMLNEQIDRQDPSSGGSRPPTG